MPDPAEPQFKHFLLERQSLGQSFTSPRRGGGGMAFPARNRQQHASRLRQQLVSVQQKGEQIQGERRAAGLATDFGLILEFASDPGFPLNVDQLENRRSHIQLLNVRKKRVPGVNGQELELTMASVRVPYGQLQRFVRMVEAYQTQNTKKGNPKNQNLIATIAEIRFAALEALWTEEERPLPRPNDRVTWEAWLHIGDGQTGREQVLQQFRTAAESVGAEILNQRIDLPENTVLLVRASRQQLESSLDLLNCLMELREPQVTAEFFAAMTQLEQKAWLQDALRRISWPGPDCPAVCLLDTGLTHEHPLLQPACAATDLHSYDPAWGVNDTHPTGHGTPMGGLALFGDLTPVMAGSMPVVLAHRLESVKMLHPSITNEPELYGDITRESIARAELAAPHRKRVFSMQVTSRNTRARGRPSSWSAAVDQLCSGAGEPADSQRLVLVSSGNVQLDRALDYPSKNETDQVHDPGQAWNAVTVGACTDMAGVDQTHWPGWQPLAPAGALGPASTTSLVWEDQWPVKPDVVFEGGNMGVHPTAGTVDYLESLQLLSTNKDYLSRLLVTTGDTSAATVQVARMAAIIASEYQGFWPETLRAVLIHSAEWTSAMLGGRSAGEVPKSHWPRILRKYGFGKPDLAKALRSARSAVTLICQDEIQPFLLDGTEVKTNELRFHNLPWPREVLQQNGMADAEMRVTVSYFIEPNPGPRQTNDRYRYASCGLRFDVRRATESEREFRARINREARGESEQQLSGGADSNEWDLGFNLRHRGSVHSDTWRGTAAQLAEKNHIAVFPVNGWWRIRKHLRRFDARLRYALVVTIQTPAQGIDIYTPVAAQIAVPITIAARS
jgi:Subtilase family